MKKRPLAGFATLVLLLSMGLVGCSRTIEDVARWKTNSNEEKLIDALQDPKIEIRITAAEALGELKAETAVDALGALYNDKEDEAVLAAVKAMAAIGSKSTTTPLVAALKLDDVRARAVAAEGLGNLRVTSAIDALAEALGDSEEEVQCAAANSLGQIGDEKGSRPLAGKLNSGSEKLRLTCVISLGQIAGKVATDGLISAMNDKNTEVRNMAIDSLVAIGKPSVPPALEALKNDNGRIRSGAIFILESLDADPTTGSDRIWFQLARVSTDNQTTIDTAVVLELAKMDGDTFETLLEAAGHNVADFREHASQALETIGQPCIEKVLEAASHTDPESLAWFDERSTWSGAPSWRIDLWGAIATLNPDFTLDSATVAAMQSQGSKAFQAMASPEFSSTRAYIPLLIGLLGDQTTPPPEQPDFDQDGMPIVKKAVDRFDGRANQQAAQDELITAGDRAVLPLIAALTDDDTLVAGHAAEILGELGDRRAAEPLIEILEQKMAEGEPLTASPFYAALQKMDDPAAEPILLKIPPDTGRAICVFERRYADIRVTMAESLDDDRPTVFRLGYIRDGKVGETRIAFAQNQAGDWVPSPPLPDNLPH